MTKADKCIAILEMLKKKHKKGFSDEIAIEACKLIDFCYDDLMEILDNYDDYKNFATITNLGKYVFKETNIIFGYPEDYTGRCATPTDLRPDAHRGLDEIYYISLGKSVLRSVNHFKDFMVQSGELGEDCGYRVLKLSDNGN